MTKHLQSYLAFFGLTKEDVIYDEYEWIVNQRLVRATNIHHIEHGANKIEDITNYMALSTEHHDMCHNRRSEVSGDFSDREKLKEIHLEFMKNNMY